MKHNVTDKLAIKGWKYNPRRRIPMKVIREVAKRIAGHFSVEKILVFGSYAYGKPQEGSDVDFLIVMNHDKLSNRKQMFEIAEMLSPIPFPMDLIVRTPEDIETRIPQGDWFLQDAYTKGRILYDRHDS
jgi:predicted nucleotidyltransferase